MNKLLASSIAAALAFGAALVWSNPGPAQGGPGPVPGSITNLQTPIIGGTTGQCLTKGANGAVLFASCGSGGVLSGANGGTGVANTGKTITLGGNLATSGSNNVTFTTTGSTNVTLPTSGTLQTVAAAIAKTANYTLQTTDTGRVFSNAGAAGTVDFTLPTSAVGAEYTVVVSDAQTVRVLAPALTIIAMGNLPTSAAGNITATGSTGAQYSAVTLKAFSSTLWIAISFTGNWTVN